MVRLSRALLSKSREAATQKKKSENETSGDLGRSLEALVCETTISVRPAFSRLSFGRMLLRFRSAIAITRIFTRSSSHSSIMAAQQQQPTAILSVYDKSGLLDLAKGLAAKGVRLLGSGGTAKLVREAGIEIG